MDSPRSPLAPGSSGTGPDADDAAALLASMAAVRERVDGHAAEWSEAVRRSKDWTSYVRSAPLACAAAAAAAGYLVVPARPRSPKVVRVKGRRSSRKAGSGRSSDASGASPAESVERPVSGKGPWMGLAAVLGNVAVRAGTAYFSQKAGTMFGGAMADAEQKADAPPQTAAGSPSGDPDSRDRAARNADRPFGGPR
ncbi:hypothetical protein [Alienimonas californiensis]|uniref:Uncharacterized protein n=1 Tax=Alienimonas californiensis TaxID=2527989 RepID=A0A517PCL7_9PLAN|nr:hypothetical protein [Alienimonas californiensis]QDT17081.1 hypothetical protein CA12_31930 [Alienimonas californiensis]